MSTRSAVGNQTLQRPYSMVKTTMLQHAFFALSATALLFAQQPAAPSSRAAELLLSKARALESRGRIDLAAQAWQQLLMIEPEQQDAIAGLARAAKARGNDAEAAVLVEKLRKINPANPAIQQVEALVRTEKRNPQLQEAARLAQAGASREGGCDLSRAHSAATRPRLNGRFLITRHSPRPPAVGSKRRLRSMTRLRKNPSAHGVQAIVWDGFTPIGPRPE